MLLPNRLHVNGSLSIDELELVVPRSPMEMLLEWQHGIVHEWDEDVILHLKRDFVPFNDVVKIRQPTASVNKGVVLSDGSTEQLSPGFPNE